MNKQYRNETIIVDAAGNARLTQKNPTILSRLQILLFNVAMLILAVLRHSLILVLRTRNGPFILLVLIIWGIGEPILRFMSHGDTPNQYVATARPTRFVPPPLNLHKIEPSDLAIRLAAEMGMTDSAKEIFYRSQPSVISDKPVFRTKCDGPEIKGVVLGCYAPEEDRIYLFDTRNSGNPGLLEVEAAHELLHAAYARLSEAEKHEIGVMIDELVKTKPSILKKIAGYPENVVSNELHSYIGTEVAHLPQNLELYYAKYFSRRSQIVASYNQSQEPYADLNYQLREYDSKLKALRLSISTLKEEIADRSSILKRKHSELTQLRANGLFEESNELVPELNAVVEEQRAAATRNEALIEQYNQLVKIRNSVVHDGRVLADAIDTRKDL